MAIIWRDGRWHMRCEQCDKFATHANGGKLGWDWFTGGHHYGGVYGQNVSKEEWREIDP